MNFTKLDQNEKTGAIASAVLVITGLIAAATYSTYAMTWLAIIAGLGMLFVVFQPQIAAGASLPGSKGSLMLVLGGVAGAIMLLAFVLSIQFVFLRFGLPDLLFLIAVASAVAMAWVGWQEFQREGGKFTLRSAPAAGTASAPAATETSAATAPPPSSPPPMESAPPPESPSAIDDPTATDDSRPADPDEDRPREA